MAYLINLTTGATFGIEADAYETVDGLVVLTQGGEQVGRFKEDMVVAIAKVPEMPVEQPTPGKLAPVPPS